MNLKFFKVSRPNLILLLFFSCIVTSGFAQEKSKKELKKELKEKQKLAQQKATEDLVNSKTFVFIPTRATPTGGRAVNLTTNTNYLKLEPKMIDSNLPFFGRVFNADYGSTDSGLKFMSEPTKYDIIKDKKNYKIDIEVKDTKDSYRLNLTVEFGGFATLSVSSNKRSTINYSGEISELKLKETKD